MNHTSAWKSFRYQGQIDYNWQGKAACCITSIETVGLSGTEAQDGHLDFHTAPELWQGKLDEVLFCVHKNHRFIRDGSPGRPPRISHSSWALRRKEKPREVYPAAERRFSQVWTHHYTVLDTTILIRNVCTLIINVRKNWYPSPPPQMRERERERERGFVTSGVIEKRPNWVTGVKMQVFI